MKMQIYAQNIDSHSFPLCSSRCFSWSLWNRSPFWLVAQVLHMWVAVLSVDDDTVAIVSELLFCGRCFSVAVFWVAVWHVSPQIGTKFSAKSHFGHFWAIDLTSEVTGWPRTLNSVVNDFVSWQATRGFFNQSSSSIKSQTRGGGVASTPTCAVKDGEMTSAGESQL